MEYNGSRGSIFAERWEHLFQISMTVSDILCGKGTFGRCSSPYLGEKRNGISEK
jgi:hypothetical protein